VQQANKEKKIDAKIQKQGITPARLKSR